MHLTCRNVALEKILDLRIADPALTVPIKNINPFGCYSCSLIFWSPRLHRKPALANNNEVFPSLLQHSRRQPNESPK